MRPSPSQKVDVISEMILVIKLCIELGKETCHRSLICKSVCVMFGLHSIIDVCIKRHTVIFKAIKLICASAVNLCDS